MIESEIIFGSYIKFIPDTPKPKTKVWIVGDEHDNTIGTISWFGRWRKYCFFPKTDTVYEQVCLREISNFIEQRTKDHKRGEL